MIGAAMRSTCFWNWVFPARRYCWSPGHRPGIRKRTNDWNLSFSNRAVNPEGFLVYRLKKSGAEAAVNLKGSTENLVGVIVHQSANVIT